MSFVEVLRGGPVAPVTPVPASRKQYMKAGKTVDEAIEQGKRVMAYIPRHYGQARADEILSGLRLKARALQATTNGPPAIEDVDAPSTKFSWGFWRQFLEDDVKVQFTQRQRKSYARSFRFYLQQQALGSTSLAALRGPREKGSFRGHGGP